MEEIREHKKRTHLQAVDTAVMRTHDFLVAGQIDMTYSLGPHVGCKRSGLRGPDLPSS